MLADIQHRERACTKDVKLTALGFGSDTHTHTVQRVTHKETPTSLILSSRDCDASGRKGSCPDRLYMEGDGEYRMSVVDECSGMKDVVG